ncbi:MAG: hypothetical protein HOB32_01850 [Nitrospina sp.]|nr:hypothetical protein [Nitrospina sp.]
MLLRILGYQSNLNISFSKLMVFLLFGIATSAYADDCGFQLDPKALRPIKKPSYSFYKNPEQLWKPEKMYLQHHKCKNFWQVWANRSGVKFYDEPYNSSNETKPNKYKATFLQPFWVVDKVDRFLLLTEPNGVEEVGWVDIEAMLILDYAYRDPKSTITHKGILINDPEAISKSSLQNVNVVFPLYAPQRGAQEIVENRIRILDFLNIYQYHYSYKLDPVTNVTNRVVDYVLMGKSLSLPWERSLEMSVTDLNSENRKRDPIKSVILGWVPVERVMLWETREAIEPNPERKQPIYYFRHSKDLEYFYGPKNTKADQAISFPNEEKLVIVSDKPEQITRVHLPPDAPRFPVTDDSSESTLIGIPGASLEKENIKVIRALENKRKLATNLDIVFAVDTSESMKDYSGELGNIIKNAFRKAQDSFTVKRVRIGGLIYRDYEDGEDVFDIKDFTDNPYELKTWFDAMKYSNKEPKDKFPEGYYPEAMFQGLWHAINDLDWEAGHTKILIHIGDHGNHSKGQDEYNEQQISKLLFEENISLFSFHVVHPSREDPLEQEASRLFITQVDKILKGLKKYFKGKAQQFNQVVELDPDDQGMLHRKEIKSPKELNKAIVESITEDVTSQITEAIRVYDRFRVGSIKKEKTKKDYWVPQPTISVLKQIREELSEKEFERWVNHKASFYYKAFVKMDPPSKDENESSQFLKVVLLTEKSLRDLIAAFEPLARRRWTPDARLLPVLWKQMILTITEEEDENNIDSRRSLNDYFKMAYGIAFENDHVLLKISLDDILKGDFLFDEKVQDLMDALKEKYNFLRQALRNENRKFAQFGDHYFWIMNHEMP